MFMPGKVLGNCDAQIFQRLFLFYRPIANRDVDVGDGS